MFQEGRAYIFHLSFTQALPPHQPVLCPKDLATERNSKKHLFSTHHASPECSGKFSITFYLKIWLVN